jgi:hypothetical protein
VLFSVWATLVIAALFVWGAFATVVASWFFTVYITWSPWHYTGQNYGLAVMFLQRRGVPPSAGVKRLFHASFLLAYLLTFTVFHGALGIPSSTIRTRRGCISGGRRSRTTPATRRAQPITCAKRCGSRPARTECATIWPGR